MLECPLWVLFFPFFWGGVTTPMTNPWDDLFVYIYLHEWLNLFGFHVGKYTIDPMGIDQHGKIIVLAVDP